MKFKVGHLYKLEEESSEYHGSIYMLIHTGSEFGLVSIGIDEYWCAGYEEKEMQKLLDSKFTYIGKIESYTYKEVIIQDKTVKL